MQNHILLEQLSADGRTARPDCSSIHCTGGYISEIVLFNCHWRVPLSGGESIHCNKPPYNEPKRNSIAVASWLHWGGLCACRSVCNLQQQHPPSNAVRRRWCRTDWQVKTAQLHLVSSMWQQTAALAVQPNNCYIVNVPGTETAAAGTTAAAHTVLGLMRCDGSLVQDPQHTPTPAPACIVFKFAFICGILRTNPALQQKLTITLPLEQRGVQKLGSQGECYFLYAGTVPIGNRSMLVQLFAFQFCRLQKQDGLGWCAGTSGQTAGFRSYTLWLCSYC